MGRTAPKWNGERAVTLPSLSMSPSEDNLENFRFLWGCIRKYPKSGVGTRTDAVRDKSAEWVSTDSAPEKCRGLETESWALSSLSLHLGVEFPGDLSPLRLHQGFSLSDVLRTQLHSMNRKNKHQTCVQRIAEAVLEG